MIETARSDVNPGYSGEAPAPPKGGRGSQNCAHSPAGIVCTEDALASERQDDRWSRRSRSGNGGHAVSGRPRTGLAPRFVFLHSSELEPTVLDSQVVDSILALGAHGLRFDMAVLLHGGPYVRNFSYTRKRRTEIADRIGGKVRVYFTPQKMKPIGDALGTAELAFDLWRAGRRRTVIHARGETSGFFASQMARLGFDVRYIYDARGDVEAEFLFQADRANYGADERSARLAGIERHRAAAIAGASHVWCVSSVLRDRLAARYGRDPRQMSVIPCVTDERKFHLDEAERQSTRRELNLTDEFVIVYPGRLGRWHCGPEMFALVQAMMKRFADVHFLVLTPDIDEGKQMASAMLPAGKYSVRSAHHTEVPRFLRAADLGILLRQSHPLNEVACPTKFGEFILSGLPVLISAGIGDCSAFVSDREAGVVLDGPDPDLAADALARVRREPGASRRARIAGLSASFSRSRAAEEMAAVYRRLATE